MLLCGLTQAGAPVSTPFLQEMFPFFFCSFFLNLRPWQSCSFGPLYSGLYRRGGLGVHIPAVGFNIGQLLLEGEAIWRHIRAARGPGALQKAGLWGGYCRRHGRAAAASFPGLGLAKVGGHGCSLDSLVAGYLSSPSGQLDRSPAGQQGRSTSWQLGRSTTGQLDSSALRRPSGGPQVLSPMIVEHQLPSGSSVLNTISYHVTQIRVLQYWRQ